MPPRTRKAESADEAQQQDPPPADQSVPEGGLGAFNRAFDVAKQQITTRVDGQIATLAGSIDNLTALVEAADGAPDSAVLGTLTEQLTAISSRLANVEGILNDDETDLVGQDDLEEFRTKVLEDVVAATSAGPLLASAPVDGVPAVYGQVAQLMKLVEKIGKEGRANYGERYSFRGIDQAMDAVGAGMRQVGLIMSTEVVDKEYSEVAVPKFDKAGSKISETIWTTTRVTMRYTFVSPDDGTTHSMEGYGVGRDSGDKDGSKSMAAAMKYALFQGLCIPVKGMNMDPEQDNPEYDGTPERPAQPQPTARPAQRQSAPAQQRPAATPSPPAAPVGQTPEEFLALKAERASKALAVARHKTRDLGELNRLVAQATKEKLLMIEVEGLPLQSHLQAIAKTLSAEVVATAEARGPADDYPLPPEPTDG